MEGVTRLKKKIAVLFGALIMALGIVGPAQAGSYESHVFTVDTIVSEIGVAWVAQNDSDGLLFYQLDVNTTQGCGSFKSDGNGKYTNIVFRTYTRGTTHTLIATTNLGNGYNCAFSKYYINTPGPDHQGDAYVTINYDVRTLGGTYHNSGGFNVCWNGPTVC